MDSGIHNYLSRIWNQISKYMQLSVGQETIHLSKERIINKQYNFLFILKNNGY